MNHLSSKTLLAALLMSVGAFGCSSSPVATAASPETFTDVYTTVLGPTCSTHHAAGQADSFLDLSTQAAAYTSLVNAKASGPACGTSGETRVVPNDAANSLLYQKVSMAKPNCGAQMPFGGTPISTANQEKILTWIDQGALNN
jgi:hypothetical protein